VKHEDVAVKLSCLLLLLLLQLLLLLMLLMVGAAHCLCRCGSGGCRWCSAVNVGLAVAAAVAAVVYVAHSAGVMAAGATTAASAVIPVHMMTVTGLQHPRYHSAVSTSKLDINSLHQTSNEDPSRMRNVMPSSTATHYVGGLQRTQTSAPSTR